MRVILQKIIKSLFFCLPILFITPIVNATQNNNKIPQRIIVLDWDLLEQVLTLDVIPIGATEIAGYNQWVAHPVAPNSIEEVGMRAEPNLEKMASLKPDLILASSSQQDLLPVLKTIAPVMYLPNFSRQDNAAEVALAHFNTLASLLGKTALAQQKLAEMDSIFVQLKCKLQRAFITLPEVEVIRFSTLTSVFLYTENSTTDYVVNKLGLNSAISLPPQPWGIDQRRMNVLQHIKQGYVLYMLPFPDESKLQKSVLWQAMPFVQNGHFHSVKPVWNYGGVTSLMLMAEAITESLLDMAPNNEH
ncbi:MULTISPECIES: iron-siderophore ABC transporter substrate-binding protein [Proteus]|jgi:iron complex transport system substrate-binding protein|uniref:ABC transporter, substrate-binding protein n=1 Tax=Proteus vulgaris TaxID=585 RepID=A0A379FE22_PROVU|nr:MULTISPECIES: iron-siderophore ABC transporter substrate-binding protein [Proteus]NBN60901.1 ABC transporter substrate-binding protein [Proteus sp. G2639]RNT29152.1 iron-siderophore ABC transporter substrate-binding protein [Proteus mirabilis]AYY80596.1 iron-siderophore ABC transporter substrate-binding protein [Proteus vulgaris]KGA59200.1 periplasmic binding family protein [Proteus vulgaris]MBG5971963.1 iron-siderophore ABC transporter substrate-binding protein [Proteus vulgaris]